MLDKASFQQELHKIIGFWSTKMLDTQRGGFYGRIDGFGVLHPDADKSVILNTRILWTFSAAARQGFAEAEPFAHRAYAYIRQYFIDAENGGVFWMLDCEGRPVDTKKQVYAQAFAIYALSEYYRFCQHQESLQLALDIFYLMEKHALDREKGGYLDAFSREWTLLDDLRLSDKDANAAKTQNTHLHIFEAYANLYKARPDAEVGQSLHKLLNLFVDKFIDPATAHIHLFFDVDWKLESDIVSYGHDIEASWLLWDAAVALGDETLMEQLKPICIRIAEVTFAEAVDSEGAIINEWHPSKGFRDTDRVWWVQVEAILGFLYAWRHTGELRYKSAAEKIWAFCLEKLPESADGEWFWSVDAEGTPNRMEDLAGPWKCPYHTSRVCLEGLLIMNV